MRLRAKGVCEYCQMPQAAYKARFHIEHIVARQHRGRTELSNLALACLRCNYRKGPNISGIDPKTRRIVRLFHPRQDAWNEHFYWRGPVLVGRTPVARATIRVLDINNADLVEVRRGLIEEGLFSP